MGQLLRITYNQKDYRFQIINSKVLSKETEEIQILLNGTTLTLIRSDSSWAAKENNVIHQNLIEAIGKAIELRYRI